MLIAGLLLCLALACTGLQGCTYYHTISEIKQQGDSAYGQDVRVAGTVAADSVQRDAVQLILRFTIDDGQQDLPVVYEGIVPDAFSAGGDVVVEGELGPDGVFQASELLVRCPSKYEPES